MGIEIEMVTILLWYRYWHYLLSIDKDTDIIPIWVATSKENSGIDIISIPVLTKNIDKIPILVLI